LKVIFHRDNFNQIHELLVSARKKLHVSVEQRCKNEVFDKVPKKYVILNFNKKCKQHWL